MNSRTTVFLVICALTLATWVWWSERSHVFRVTSPSGALASYEPVRPGDIHAIEIFRGAPLLRVERTNGTWHLTEPVRQPARAATVEAFLDALNRLQPEGYVSASEMQASPGLEKSFGLDTPSATRLVLHGRGGTTILQIGSRAPIGSRFFFQRLGDAGVFSAHQGFLDALPAAANDWRDHSLLGFQLAKYDQIEVHQRGALAFEAHHRPTHGWQLRRPLSARADEGRLHALVQQVQHTQVESFVSDEGPFDDPRFELTPPRAECILRAGTNVVAHLQFGATHPEYPHLRYALRVDRNSLLLVPEDAIDPVLRPVNQYRDRRLIASVEGVNQLTLADPDGFTVARDGTNWHVLSPVSTQASRPIMEAQLQQFAAIEIAEFVNDVITDLTRYGFDRPAREYTLARDTNVLARIQIGNPVPPDGLLVHARRLDEPAVYAVPRSVLTQLAASHLQIRDATFTPRQVRHIRIDHKGRVRELFRNRAQSWENPGTPEDQPIAEAVDETLLRLGALVVERFPIPDPEVLRQAYRLDELQHAITLSFESGATLRRLKIELGGSLGPRLAAFVTFDEDPTPIQMFLPAGVAELLLTQLAAP